MTHFVYYLSALQCNGLADSKFCNGKWGKRENNTRDRIYSKTAGEKKREKESEHKGKTSRRDFE